MMSRTCALSTRGRMPLRGRASAITRNTNAIARSIAGSRRSKSFRFERIARSTSPVDTLSTPDGRALPPLLRVNDNGDQFYGTTDAEQSVIRIARTDGMGGPAIYDFTDRLFMGKGPIVIDKFADGFAVTSGPAVPLDGLQSSVEVVAFARDEGIEGNLNGDADPDDRVVQIVVTFSYLLGLLVFILDLVYVIVDPRIHLIPKSAISQSGERVKRRRGRSAGFFAWRKDNASGLAKPAQGPEGSTRERA